MGEAKQRGTYEERVIQSMLRKIDRRVARLKMANQQALIVRRPAPGNKGLAALQLNADRRATVVNRIIKGK